MDIKYIKHVTFSNHWGKQRFEVRVTLIAKFKKDLVNHYEVIRPRSGFDSIVIEKASKILKFIPPNSTRDGRKNIQVGRKGYY